MPAHMVLQDFLEKDTVAGLLAHALAHETEFAPTRTGHGEQSGLRPNIRVSFGTRNLGPFQVVLEARIFSLLPQWIEKFRLTSLESPKLETQLVAHNDGAFYRRHIDTKVASRADRIRVLSGVYYFHAASKAFTGGALRLYAVGDPSGRTFVDIEPEHNSLVVFPSWVPHEVMPVSCPSKRFIDSRFAINCWVDRDRSAGKDSWPEAGGESSPAQ